MKRLAINNPFNAPVFYEETVTSTMDIARELAARGDVHGTVIAAGFQEAGRGRIPERPWNMERGSLPFTILLRYPRIEDIPQAFTLRCGLALALAMEDFVPALSGTVRIKWPNDIMIRISEAESKKTAGILSEAAAGFVLAGMGINIAQKEFPPSLRDKATSLSLASGTDIDGEARFCLLEKILSRLYSEFEMAHNAEDGQTYWRDLLADRLYKKGESVCFAPGRAIDRAGGFLDDSDTDPAIFPSIVKGRIEGLGPNGELLIVPDGETVSRSFFVGELLVY